ncbi:protein phosphatase PTC7 homolog [Manduca sexta]|uniref:protein phosphatase PTC7 homolog n=1 Tax=Manduca sexta TaxID=7130 RepID=UPI001890005E|nr:protein phosphatase PTC7 homolog [Manduca sexta]
MYSRSTRHFLKVALWSIRSVGTIFVFRPESAETSEFAVECGDVILVATDGVFDNVPEPVLVAEMRRAQGLAGDSQRLQAVANSIAWMARNLSFDGCYMSPFAKSARQNGIDAIGGKPDDITVLLAIVAL